jgi:hypothetical protein
MIKTINNIVGTVANTLANTVANTLSWHTDEVNNSLNKLSLSDQEYNPGTILKEINNDTEYIFLGYDNSRENLICTTTSGNMLNNNIYVIKKNNIAKIIKLNKMQVNTRYVFE